MRNLKIWMLLLFCINVGCSRTVDVSPPISKDASTATPSPDAPSDGNRAVPGESSSSDDNATKN